MSDVAEPLKSGTASVGALRVTAACWLN
jgi:hypothetical protein